MEKHEHLTGDDLGYKAGVLEKAKFEYSPLGEASDKAFKKVIKIKKSINTGMICCMILCITLINILCLILMKYHQLSLNLIQ